jgi:hypothetical protein
MPISQPFETNQDLNEYAWLAVGRSDMHKGWTFEESQMYVMKCQLNATSKSQVSNN